MQKMFYKLIFLGKNCYYLISNKRWIKMTNFVYKSDISENITTRVTKFTHKVFFINSCYIICVLSNFVIRSNEFFWHNLNNWKIKNKNIRCDMFYSFWVICKLISDPAVWIIWVKKLCKYSQIIIWHLVAKFLKKISRKCILRWLLHLVSSSSIFFYGGFYFLFSLVDSGSLVNLVF